jgi:hypothetical protein
MAIIGNLYFNFNFAARWIHLKSIFFVIPTSFSLKFTEIMDHFTYYHPTADHFSFMGYLDCYISHFIINFDFTKSYAALIKIKNLILYFY